MANYNKSFNFRNGVQVDNDNFIVNSNGLVGIGTTIPRDYFLNVYGDTRVTGLVTANNLYTVNSVATGISTVGFLTALDINVSGVVTATSFSGSASGLTGIYAIAVDGWYVDSGFISTTSNVGIGTTIPGAKLEVIPSSTGIAGLFSGTTSGDMVRITQTGTGNALVVEDYANPDATPFVVNADGSVGIGTNPSNIHVLRIYNTLQISNSTEGDSSFSGLILGYQSTPGVNNMLSWSKPLWIYSGFSDVIIQPGGDNDLNVGIGTTLPNNKLDVIGNTYISGNIGIGSTSPTEKLEVRGNTKSEEFIGGGSDIRNLSGTHLVSYASASDISNSALSISGISSYREVGILTGTYASDSSDYFGFSVATSADGKTIVVGAISDEFPGSGGASGVVYVYDRVGNTFNEVGILTGTYASNSSDFFGRSVATSADGKTIIVGDSNDEVPGSGSASGVVYVYDRVGNTFNEVGILTGTYASNSNDFFGQSVATSADGKTIVVGAISDEVPGSGPGSGVVYVYDRVGNTFNEVAVFKGTYSASDQFGFSVATSADGKTIVVGAPDDEVPDSGPGSGVVYVYDRVGNTFNEVAVFKGTYSALNDQFGFSVATSADGKTIVVGALSDEFTVGNHGLVYVYDRVGNTFNEVAVLKGTYATGSNDQFGFSVATSADGKTIVVGAPDDEFPGSGGDSGLVYIYNRIGNTFNEVGILTGTYSSDSNDFFGQSVATSADGKTIIVGAPNDEFPGSGSGSGITYVFDETRETYVYSDSSGNIGIGITIPGAKLEVIPSSTGIAGLFSGTTSGDMVRITQTGTGNALVVEDSTNPDSSPFVVNADGNIGVGTTNPTSDIQVRKASGSLVEVVSDSGQARISIGQSVGVGNSSSVLRFGNSDGVLDIINNDVGDIKTIIHGGTGAGSTGNFKWVYGQTNLETMTLTYDGNLGINDITPSQKLSVGGGVTVTGDVYINSNLTVDGNISGNIDYPDVISGSNLYTTSGITTLVSLNVNNNVDFNGATFVGLGTIVGVGTTVPESSGDDIIGLTVKNSIATNKIYVDDLIAINSGVITATTVSASFNSSDSSNPSVQIEVLSSPDRIVFTVLGVGSTTLNLF